MRRAIPLALLALAVHGCHWRSITCGEGTLRSGDRCIAAPRHAPTATGEASESATGSREPSGARTQIVFLGTGNPTPDPARSGPATAIVVDGVAYLFDAGPGVVRRAAAAATRLGIAALAPKSLRWLFVTHLHSDHTLGYPDLLLTPWVAGRAFPLEVYGPRGLAAMTTHLREAFAEDIEIRTHAGGEAKDDLPTRANVHEIAAGDTYADERVKITAIPVTHGTWQVAFGYRIVTPDRTIVITGDYAPSDSLVAACDGCDLLISEAYADANANKRTPQWRAYLRAFHISALELGELATRAHARRVAVIHRFALDTDDQVILDEVHRAFAGPVEVPADLDRL
jgi:ribonuclease Z